MAERAWTLVVRVNGHHHAFQTELGRDTARDRVLRADPFHAANTSCSVLLRDAERGQIALHLLFDVGLGVVNRLLEWAARGGPQHVDAVFLTHPHLDHYAELDRLANSLQRARRLRGDESWRLPVHCTAPCAAQAFGERGAFAWLAAPGRHGRVTHHPVMSCQPVRFSVENEVVTVTPVSVYHGPTAPGAVIYVVEGAGRKVIFAWDVLRVVEEPAEPSEAERAAHVTALPVARAGLVRDADLLFLDANTWLPHPSTGHLSIVEGLALARAWRPRRLYWTHYGGHEDLLPAEPAVNPVLELPDVQVRRPLTDPELHWLAGYVSRALGMDVRFAYEGMVVPDTEPWPEAAAARFG